MPFDLNLYAVASHWAGSPIFVVLAESGLQAKLLVRNQLNRNPHRINPSNPSHVRHLRNHERYLDSFEARLLTEDLSEPAAFEAYEGY